MHFDAAFSWRISHKAAREHAAEALQQGDQPATPHPLWTPQLSTVFFASSPTSLTETSHEGPAVSERGIIDEDSQVSSSLEQQVEQPYNKNHRFLLNSVDDDLLTRELTLRSTPLRSVWEARGAGAWQWCRKVGLLAQETDGPILIQPVLPFHSGGSILDLSRRTLQIEALLHDTHWHSPEWLRILRQVARLGMLELFALEPPLQAPSAETDLKFAPLSRPRLTLALAAADLITEWGAEWVEIWQPGTSQLLDRDKVVDGDQLIVDGELASDWIELRESLRLSAPIDASSSPASVASWLKTLLLSACGN